MSFALSHYVGWLIVAVAAGLTTAWLARRETGADVVRNWKLWAGGLFAAMLALALFQTPFGRWGAWIEIAVAVAACFALGAALGALLFGARVGATAMWLTGLGSAAVIWALASLSTGGALQSRLEREARQALAGAGANPAGVAAEGRDLLLARNAVPPAQRGAITQRLAAIEGVRRVGEGPDLPPPPPEVVERERRAFEAALAERARQKAAQMKAEADRRAALEAEAARAAAAQREADAQRLRTELAAVAVLEAKLADASRLTEALRAAPLQARRESVRVPGLEDEL
ncbi:MAG: hypothetical protein JNK46_16910, partial [Methylobacteriaceae bacterium]|nr:hypothetical protein [Methylobacteriaceae bacterium]